jgi:hypothetical protein
MKKRWKNYPRLAAEQEAGRLPLQSKIGLLFMEEQKNCTLTLDNIKEASNTPCIAFSGFILSHV